MRVAAVYRRFAISKLDFYGKGARGYRPIRTHSHGIAGYIHSGIVLRAKLLQVVIDMFVHSGAPFQRGNWTKKGMGIRGAPRFSALVEFLDTPHEPVLLSSKLALVDDLQLLGRWAIVAEGLVLHQYMADPRTHNSAQQTSFCDKLSRSHFQRRAAMRQHLCHVHLAPLAL